MRKLYPLTLLAVIFLFPGCSKDVLKSYDKRVLGTWKITDVSHYGFNGRDALPFKEDDLLTFGDDGALTVQRSGSTYQGSWDIERIHTSDNKETKALVINAINFADQQVRSEYFNDMAFTATNRFKTFINYNTRVYVYRFQRQ